MKIAFQRLFMPKSFQRCQVLNDSVKRYRVAKVHCLKLSNFRV